MTAEDKHKTRTRLAEWSKTPEGKAKYEQVAKEMREQMWYEALDKAAMEHEREALDFEYTRGLHLRNMTSFKKGAQWQKKELMESAVGGYYHKVHLASGNWVPEINIDDMAKLKETVTLLRLKDDDKVRIIILPSDEK